MLRTVRTLYVDAITPGNIKHYMPGIFVQIWLAQHSLTVRALGRQTQMAHIHQQSYQYTPTTKKKRKKHPENSTRILYIPYFSFFVANAAILFSVMCVLLNMSLQNGILEDGCAAAGDAPPFWRRPHPSSKDPMGLLSLEQVMFCLHFLQDQPAIFDNCSKSARAKHGIRMYSHDIYRILWREITVWNLESFIKQVRDCSIESSAALSKVKNCLITFADSYLSPRCVRTRGPKFHWSYLLKQTSFSSWYGGV